MREPFMTVFDTARCCVILLASILLMLAAVAGVGYFVYEHPAEVGCLAGLGVLLGMVLRGVYIFEAD